MFNLITIYIYFISATRWQHCQKGLFFRHNYPVLNRFRAFPSLERYLEVSSKLNFQPKMFFDFVWISLEKKMQHNRKYRNLGWWAAHWLFYNLGRIQNDGNLNDGFWLIQKLDCFGNKLKNPRIWCRKLFVLGSLGYHSFDRIYFFVHFSSVCIWKMGCLFKPLCLWMVNFFHLFKI